MSINDQLDENASDFRDIQPDSEPSEANVPVAPVISSPKGGISKTQIILSLAVMVGFVILVYFFLQRQAASHPSESIPVQQPLHTNK